MKAVIMEIHKDYCIVLTEDGQFLKRKIPAGVFEIGDEIVIDQEFSYEPTKAPGISWLKKFAVTAFIVAIVVIGSILGVQYVRQHYLSESAGLFDQYEYEELRVAEEEEAEEEEAVQAVETQREETIVYENIYSVEEGTEVEENIKGIMFSYDIVDDTNLQVRMENINNTPYFNGTFKINMLLFDGSTSRTSNIPLQGFKPGQVRESSIIIKTGEVSFRLQVIEITY